MEKQDRQETVYITFEIIGLQKSRRKYRPWCLQCQELKTLLERSSHGAVSEVAIHTVIDSVCLPLTSSNISSPSILQKSWFYSTMRPLTGTNSSRMFLPSTQSSSAACREGEFLLTEENAENKKAQGNGNRVRGKRQKTEGILNRTVTTQDVFQPPSETAIEAMDRPGEICFKYCGAMAQKVRLGSAPANITDETIDQALVAPKEKH
ncbi:hypothetical protein G9A89_004994 [Geosiphon pyriformis]|nr:hypothetical protein G9A89_004994 [Geosiphon pyriformis]